MSKKSEIEARIERQELIGEAEPGSYQPTRFTRIKYKACPYTHIDIRRFQRAYNDEDEEIWYPTKTGFRFPETEFRRVIREYTLMPETYIHPEIAKRSFSLLKSEQYESAVVQGFKVIETTVREHTNAPPEEVGVKLLRRAFHPETGPLADPELPRVERDAFAHYIAGAFAFYKNPCSHRDVEMDLISAFERLVVASTLLKTVEVAIERNSTPSTAFDSAPSAPGSMDTTL